MYIYTVGHVRGEYPTYLPVPATVHWVLISVCVPGDFPLTSMVGNLLMGMPLLNLATQVV